MRPSDRPLERQLTSVCAGQSWCGAPRRNRTGDPILTMEPPGTAVRTAVPPGHARPSGPKLWVLLRRRDALTFRYALRERKTPQPAHRTRSVLPSTIDCSLWRKASVGGAVRVIGPQAHRSISRPEDGRAVDLDARQRDPSFRPHAGKGQGPRRGQGPDPVLHVPAPPIRR